MLDQPSAAFFASLSAHLLPITSLWLDIHLMESEQEVSLAACRSDWIRCCPAVVLGVLSVRITD